MEFSVLTSVYCKESPTRFDMALESNLINQTLKPNEMILVCDGPLTDELNMVIEKYKKMFPEILKVYSLKENVGLGNALNFGLEKCTYDLVARSDSDDVCVPERFALQIKYMEEHPEISVSSGIIDEFCDNYLIAQRTKNMPLTHDEICRYAKKRNPINHMAVIFKKNDVIEVGSYKHLPLLEDYYLWVRLIVAGKKIGNLDKLLVHACVGNGMVNRRGDKRYIKGWKKLGKYMLENDLQSFGGYLLFITKIILWCYMPNVFRKIAYKVVLRDNEKRFTIKY